jgi:hypothetical protein
LTAAWWPVDLLIWKSRFCSFICNRWQHCDYSTSLLSVLVSLVGVCVCVCVCVCARARTWACAQFASWLQIKWFSWSVSVILIKHILWHPVYGKVSLISTAYFAYDQYQGIVYWLWHYTSTGTAAKLQRKLLPEDGGSSFLRNPATYLPHYTSQPGCTTASTWYHHDAPMTVP